MTSTDRTTPSCNADQDRLLRLAHRVREISETPVNAERRQAWLAHHGLQGTRPMILIEAHELAPLLGLRERLVCEDRWARDIEGQLLAQVWRFEELGDDAVVEPVLNCSWQVSVGDFGVSFKEETGSSEHGGSKHWDPVITDLDRGLDVLHPRSLTVDRDASLQNADRAANLLAGILDVRIRGNLWWTTGMTSTAIKLMGMEAFLMGMIDNPDGIHRLMSFLRDDQLHFIRTAEELGLLTLNNENDYVGAGSLGYVPDLPQRPVSPGEPAPTRDMWVLSESQETVGVSPEMFAEFIFPYQLSIIEPFGLSYYGCCEPIHLRWHVVKQIPNLRAVSVSPWCDQAFMADVLKRDYVYCRKPNPALISTERFNENAIREDIEETIRIAGTCNLEIVMKDIHTLSGEPARARRWVDIAREVCGTEKPWNDCE